MHHIYHVEGYSEMQNMLYNMKKSTVYLIFYNNIVPLPPIWNKWFYNLSKR